MNVFYSNGDYAHPLFCFEEKLQIFPGKIIFVGISDHEEIYLRSRAYVFVQIREFFAWYLSFLKISFLRIQFLKFEKDRQISVRSSVKVAMKRQLHGQGRSQEGGRETLS